MIEPSLEPAIRAFAAHPSYLALPTSAGEDAPDLETTSLLNPALTAAAFEKFNVRNPAARAQLMSSLAVPLRRSVRSFLVPTGTNVVGQRLAAPGGDVDGAKDTLLESFASLRKRQEAEFAIREVKQGIVAFQEGNNTRALAKYKAALNHDPECTEAFVARGALYAKAEKYESAIADFDRALELDPTHNNAASYRRMTCKKLAEVEREKESARNGEFLMPLDYDPRARAPPSSATVSVSSLRAPPVVPHVGFSSSVASSLGAPTPAGSIGDGDDRDADDDGTADRRSRPRAPARGDKRRSMGSPPPPRKKKKRSSKDKKSRRRSARGESSDSDSSSVRRDKRQ
ncbi:hypothetical protein BDZ88DRAFT_268948 [Geranomyces variabilis]|nr:hypothetical protein BDZ88DRAFT_268948 [Geranomyces variabilis]KAJ3132401.1 hypothetical protein HDU90_006915 [Geranomyces variabilis]